MSRREDSSKDNGERSVSCTEQVGVGGPRQGGAGTPLINVIDCVVFSVCDLILGVAVKASSSTPSHEKPSSAKKYPAFPPNIAPFFRAMSEVLNDCVSKSPFGRLGLKL